jgi:hypothetical protein
VSHFANREQGKVNHFVGNGIELYFVRACIPQDFGKIINEEREAVSFLWRKPGYLPEVGK